MKITIFAGEIEQLPLSSYLGGVICYKSATYECWAVFGRDFKS